jgi:formylglycine-generating enzyme required for sulfatase activity
LNNKGLVLHEQGKYLAAIKCYNKALNFVPKDIDILNNKGDAYFKLKEYKDSSKCYDRVSKINSQLQSFIEPEMIYIKGGIFDMGSNNSCNGAKPVHSVIVSSFYIGKYPVTNKEYCKYDLSHKNPGDNLPVVNVSWKDAVSYCRWLSRETGSNYRLPTETEWEYACRAGSKTEYYWGNEMDASYCWYYDNSEGKVHPVGQKKPNAFELYDMSGNVSEWCIDRNGNYPSGSVNNPIGAKSGLSSVRRGALCDLDWRDDKPLGSSRIARGGSGFSLADNCRSAYRNWFSPSDSSSLCGFRVVRKGWARIKKGWAAIKS